MTQSESSEPEATDLVPHCDVVVAIINHCNVEQLRVCLSSIREVGSEGLDVRVVVLDNASNDGSVESIREEFPEVGLIAQPYRAGFGENHNRIVAETSSRYVFVLNDDTEVGADAIPVLVAMLEANPEVGIVGPRIEYYSDVEHQSAWRFPSPIGCVMHAATFGTLGIVQSRTTEKRAVDWVSGSAMMVRRSAFEEVGGFDETIYMYMEETDLCRRLWSAGYQVWFQPDAVVRHSGWGSTASIPHPRVNELWRSRRYYWSKHHTRAGSLVASAADFVRYGAGTCASVVAQVGPGRERFENRAYHLHARNALGLGTGSGIRELSRTFNADAPEWGAEENRRAADAPGLPPADDKAFAPRSVTRGVAKAVVERATLIGNRGWRGRELAAGLRILNFHRVSDDHDQLAISPEMFARQLELVAELGYRVVDLATGDLSAAAEEPLIAFTFDDGYRDVVDHAEPLLRERGWTAMVFVVPGTVDKIVDFPWYRARAHPPVVGWDEMRRVEADGCLRFEPHGLAHRHLPSLTRDEALFEIGRSRERVELELGRPASVFCYAGGYFGPRDEGIVEECGFSYAVSCIPGLNTVPFRPLALRRTHVDRYDVAWTFRGRLLGATDVPWVSRRARAS